MPSFSAQILNDTPISADSLKGKIVVFNIWATWCGNCLHEIPSLNLVAAKYSHNKSVVFLAVTDEPEATVTNF